MTKPKTRSVTPRNYTLQMLLESARLLYKMQAGEHITPQLRARIVAHGAELERNIVALEAASVKRSETMLSKQRDGSMPKTGRPPILLEVTNPLNESQVVRGYKAAALLVGSTAASVATRMTQCGGSVATFGRLSSGADCWTVRKLTDTEVKEFGTLDAVVQEPCQKPEIARGTKHEPQPGEILRRGQQRR